VSKADISRRTLSWIIDQLKSLPCQRLNRQRLERRVPVNIALMIA
jgi:hypothetical protein